MKKEKLIEELQKLPDGIEICLFDWRQNIFNHSGELDDPSNGIGIHDEFKVEHVKENVSKPFAVLSFENSDYEPDGTPEYGSRLADHIAKEYQ